MSINNKIIEARKKKKLTQEELGKKVGVTKSAVMKWEKGIVENIKRSTIIKLSQELGLSPLDILGIDSKSKNNLDQKLLTDFHKLNPDGQDKVIEYTHDLTGLPQYLVKIASSG